MQIPTKSHLTFGGLIVLIYSSKWWEEDVFALNKEAILANQLDFWFLLVTTNYLSFQNLLKNKKSALQKSFKECKQAHKMLIMWHEENIGNKILHCMVSLKIKYICIQVFL